jgi:hypothetical protein
MKTLKLSKWWDQYMYIGHKNKSFNLKVSKQWDQYIRQWDQYTSTI